MAFKPFIGTHTCKVDQKGRVSVPAKFRTAIASNDASATVVLRWDATLGCLEGSGMDRLERLAEEAPDLTTEDTDADVDIFGEFEEVSHDPSGRMVLPGRFMDLAGFDGTAVFVGAARFFRIWTPEALEAHKAQKAQRQGGPS